MQTFFLYNLKFSLFEYYPNPFELLVLYTGKKYFHFGDFTFRSGSLTQMSHWHYNFIFWEQHFITMMSALVSKMKFNKVLLSKQVSTPMTFTGLKFKKKIYYLKMHPLHPPRPLFAADPRNLYNRRRSSVESGINFFLKGRKWMLLCIFSLDEATGTGRYSSIIFYLPLQHYLAVYNRIGSFQFSLD